MIQTREVSGSTRSQSNNYLDTFGNLASNFWRINGANPFQGAQAIDDSFHDFSTHLTQQQAHDVVSQTATGVQAAGIGLPGLDMLSGLASVWNNLLGGSPTDPTFVYSMPIKAAYDVGNTAQKGAGIGARTAALPIVAQNPQWGINTFDQRRNFALDTNEQTNPVTGGQAYVSQFATGGKINPFDDQQRAKAFTADNAPYKWQSGITDAVLTTVFDPTNFAGPAFKGFDAIVAGEKLVSRAPTNLLTRISTITPEQSLQRLDNGAYQSWIEHVNANQGNPFGIRQHEFISGKNSRGFYNVDPNMQDAVATLWSQASTPELQRDVWIVTNKADTPAGVAKAAHRLVDAAVDKPGTTGMLVGRIISGRAELFAKEPGSNLVRTLGTGENAQQLENLHTSIVETLADMETPVGVAVRNILDKLDSVPVPPVNVTPKTGVAGAAATARAGRRSSFLDPSLVDGRLIEGLPTLFDEDGHAIPNFMSWQPTALHPQVNVIDIPKSHAKSVADFFGKERPSGYIFTHDGNSWLEIKAMIDHFNKYTDGAFSRLTPEEQAAGQLTEGQLWLNRYLESTSEGQRGELAKQIELRGMIALAAKHGISAGNARLLHEELVNQRTAFLAQHNEQGFMSHFEDGQVTHSTIPLLQRENVNQIHIALNARELDKAFASPAVDHFRKVNYADTSIPGMEMSPSGDTAFRGLAGVGENWKDGMDAFNTVFKTAVLMRLGYPVRNLAEAGLSIAASGHAQDIALTSVKTFPKSVTAWAVNRKTGLLELGDRIASSGFLPKIPPKHQIAVLEHYDQILAQQETDINQRLNFLTNRMANLPIPEDASPELLQQISRIRGEMTLDHTYHATTGEFGGIEGDFLPTTHSFNRATQHAEQSWDIKSIEDFTPDAITSEPAKANRAERGVILRDLITYIEDELASGKYVEQRTPTKWMPVTPEKLDAWVQARTYPLDSTIQAQADEIMNHNRSLGWIYHQDWPERIAPGSVFKPFKGDLRQVVRSVEPDQIPNVMTVPSYGHTLDLTTAEGRTLVPSTPEGMAELTKYCRREGIGKVRIPDEEWGTTTLVLRDTADKGLGGQGTGPLTRLGMNKIMLELRNGIEANIAPTDFNSRAAVRQMRQGVRGAERRTRDAVKSLTPTERTKGLKAVNRSVIPNYVADTVDNWISNGQLENVLRENLTMRAQARVDREQILAMKAERKAVLSARGNRRISTLTGIADATDAAFFKRISAGGTFERLLADGTNFIRSSGASVPTTLSPKDPQYFSGWAEMLNTKFGDTINVDPIVKQALDGETPDSSINWATNTAEGRRYVHQFNWQDPEQAIHDIHSGVSLYLPTPHIRSMFLNGDVTEESLAAATEGMQLHPLHMNVVPWTIEYMDTKNLAASFTANAAKKIMHWIGSMPEDHFARFPLFRAVYQKEWKRLSREAAARLGTDSLTLPQVERLRVHAAETARQTVNSTLYTIERNSDSATKLRWIAPFIQAYTNSIKRWTGFVVNNPENVLRMSSKAAQVANNLTIVGRDGQPLTVDEAVKPENILNSTILLPASFIPKSWRDSAGEITHVNIPLTSIDVIMGGQAGPGLGPLGELPFYELVKNRPDAYDSLKFLFPAGLPANELSMILPAWTRRVESSLVEDSVYGNTKIGMIQNELTRLAKGERSDVPTSQEIDDKTNFLYALRGLTNLVAPFTVQYGTDLDFYLSQYRAIQAANAGQPNALELTQKQFLEKHPEAYAVLQSRSENTFGLTPTAAAVENAKKYSDYASFATSDEVKDSHLFGFVGNYGIKYDPSQFNPAAYAWERNNGPEKGRPETYRTAANPNNTINSSFVDKGWSDFTKHMDAFEAGYTQQGINLGTPDGQALLAQERSNYAKAHAKMTMPDGSVVDNPWYVDYHDTNMVKYEQRSKFFKKVLDPQGQFMKDHGKDLLLNYMQAYLDLRDKMEIVLRQRGLQPNGSMDINAKRNGDLAAGWHGQIEEWKKQNMEFAAWVNRYFTNDKVVL